jgi:hypothetical protein
MLSAMLPPREGIQVFDKPLSATNRISSPQQKRSGQS